MNALSEWNSPLTDFSHVGKTSNSICTLWEQDVVKCTIKSVLGQTIVIGVALINWICRQHGGINRSTIKIFVPLRKGISEYYTAVKLIFWSRFHLIQSRGLVIDFADACPEHPVE